MKPRWIFRTGHPPPHSVAQTLDVDLLQGPIVGYLLVPGLAFAPEFQLQALGHPAQRAQEAGRMGACVPEQQSVMTGCISYFQDTCRCGDRESQEGGGLAILGRARAGWTMLPDVCPRWLCQVCGSLAPFLMHQDMA